MSNPRKPVELKIAQGTDRPDRRGPAIEGSHSMPRMPYGLAKEAVPYWHKLARLLARRGVLVESDIPALADMCLVRARLDATEALISEQGLLVEGRSGIVRNPLMMVASQYRTAWLSYCARFALTPSDRAGITVASPEAKSLSEILADEAEEPELVGTGRDVRYN